MKKVIAWLLVLALTAAVSIGATLAYLTDTDEDVNVMTIGKVKIDQLEYERIDTETTDEDATVQEFHDNKPLYPAVTDKDFNYAPGTSYVDWEQIGKDGYTSDIWDPTKINNEVDKMVFVKNKGDYDAYVRSVFAFEAGKYTTLDEFQKMVHLNLNETEWTWEWVEAPVAIGESTYFVATATYNKVLAPGAYTEISLSQIALDKTATNEDVLAFGDTYQVLVKSQAIQADGFDSAATALNEGFGLIDASNVPWSNDAATKGVNLRKALHYYEGDTSNQITTKVTNVTYALNSEYPEIIDAYDGTLVDVDQDVPVYAYYVPSGSGNYDVYFLANDVIYSPEDSSKLYLNMTALQTVDTHNYDVSRVNNAFQMFAKCTALKEIDVSEWDTSNISDMTAIFYMCRSLPVITGIENWDTSACTTLYCAFYKMLALESLDLSGWDVRNVTDLRMAIFGNDKLLSVDLTGWNIASPCNASQMLANNVKLQEINAAGMNTSGITDASSMFQGDNALKTITGHDGWSFSSLKNATWMFDSCKALESLNVANWGLSNLEQASGMFSYTTSLKNLEGSGKWDLGKVINADEMFRYNAALPYLDVTNWDMGSCVTMSLMFRNCDVLETLEGSENWNTGNVESMYAVFYYDYKLKDLDVSTWDTGKVTTMYYMFGRCYELEELDVANWDVSNVTDFSYMFKAPGNTGRMTLKKFDVSKWNTESATTTMCMFYGCGQLTSVDMSGWNTANLESMSHMFADCYKLEQVDFTGWETPKLKTVDALFNNCESLKSVDVSSLDTANVVEFSQVFEYCYSLEEIIGLDKWDTTSGQDFGEMFSSCGRLKTLDLSSFNTTNAQDSYVNTSNGDGNDRFNYFLSGCNSLEKITLGENFSFDGDGSFTKWTFVMPSATNVNGWDGYWYDADGNAYAPSAVPEETARTYYAVKPVTP